MEEGLRLLRLAYREYSIEILIAERQHSGSPLMGKYGTQADATILTMIEIAESLKDLHRKEIEDAFNAYDYFFDSDGIEHPVTAERYYNETFEQ